MFSLGRFAHSIYHRHYGGNSDDRRRVRGGDWSGLPDRHRQVHREARARLGELKRLSVRVAAIAAFAAVAATLTLSPAGSAQAAGPIVLDPPAGHAAAIPFSELPDCSVVDTLPGMGLGWRGTRTGVLTGPGGVMTLAPTSPCTNFVSGHYQQTNHFGYRFISGFRPNKAVGQSGFVTLTCSGSSTGSSPFDLARTVRSVPGGPSTDPGTILRFDSSGSSRFYNEVDCPYLVKMILTVTQWDGTVKISTVWKPSFWTSADGGWSATEGVLDPLYEAPIVCSFSPSGGDLFALIGSAFAAVGSWVGCMVTPVGWDRSGRIAAEWEGSSLSGMQRALLAVMPSSLSCGAVATVPVFGSSVALNTCSANFAPSWVKTGLSWLIMLVCGIAIVRRVLWAVGSS